MTGEQEPVLARLAHERRVVVVGGGMAGLVAARECAKVGMQVVLVEARPELGGALRRAEIDGVVVDAGAESYATRGGRVRALLEELGLGELVVTPRPGGAWLAGIPGVGAVPLPKGGILGIPANPFAEDVRAVIGWGGAWRAYLDRLRPPLTIGHQHSLGKLVGSRMGAKVRDRLVAPVTAGVYSAQPEQIDTELAAPGLNAALTQMGSLSGAVQRLLDERSSGKSGPPGAAVEGVRGGMTVLVDALRADLEKLGVVIRTAAPVQALVQRDGVWSVTVSPAAAEEEIAEPETFEADGLIVATEEPAARALLDGHLTLPDAVAESPQIELVTLLLDAPALDAAPRGTGALTVPGSFRAKAMTHATAKWEWLREAAAGRHVVRVSFGTQGEVAPTLSMDDDAAADLALAEASAMLGVPLTRAQLRGFHRSRFTQAQPASLIGSVERRHAVREAVAAHPGLAVVGAWLAGTGLAQVVPDAASQAERLRHQLLWSGGTPR